MITDERLKELIWEADRLNEKHSSIVFSVDLGGYMHLRYDELKPIFEELLEKRKQNRLLRENGERLEGAIEHNPADCERNEGYYPCPCQNEVVEQHNKLMEELNG